MPELPELSADERLRYSRHLLLGEVGELGQRRLKAASVLCVGAGGLGSPALLYLAAAGVGRIGIADGDAVEVSNLQRQIVHGTSRLGRSKVDSARDRLLDLNPFVQVATHGAITRENALEMLADYDLVIDGTDNFPTRYLVNDAAVLSGKPYVYGSIFKFEGQASVFNHQGGPDYRDLYPEPPAPGSVPSCGEAGVLGVLPAVIGAIQATEALKILLGLGGTLSGRLLLYDALAMSFRELELRRDPHRPPVTELSVDDGFCGVPRPSAVRLGARAVKERLEAGWSPYVLDVRAVHEAAGQPLSIAHRVHPHDQIVRIAEDLPRDRDLLVSCRSGVRSSLACAALAELGFTRLFELEGGVLAWSSLT
jgi:molybdopterin/thiamine biosynthesis adenylyltransferase/rhodanese-related sulfurtransferase